MPFESGTSLVYLNDVTKEGMEKESDRLEGRKMKANRLVKRIASGVLTVGMLAGLGIAAGSTASAADRNYGSRDQYHSSDGRDARDRDNHDRDDRFRGVNWGDGSFHTDRDGQFWFQDHDGRWQHRPAVRRDDNFRDRR